MNSVSVTRPGKLYLCGEYAVVEGAHAVLLPTRVGLHVTLRAAEYDRIESSAWSEPKDITPKTLLSEEPWAQAWVVCERLRDLKALPKHPLHVRIDSDLDGPLGSLGLGSSGALTVALIEAYATFYGIPLTAMQLYQLAVIAQHKHRNTASFGDLACSAFATPLLYKRPDPQWLEEHRDDDLGVLLTLAWPGLVCQPLTVERLPLLVVNSQVKTDSNALVSQLKQHPLNATLISQIDRLSVDLAHALSTDLNAVPALIDAHHHALLTLTQPVHSDYWVSAYDDLLSHLSGLSYRVKVSGAGGGDNLIVWVQESDTLPALKQRLNTTRYPVLNNLIEGVWS